MKLTTEQAIGAFGVLMNSLDGCNVQSEGGLIRVSYKLGKVRKIIARNAALLRPVTAKFEEGRNRMIREAAGGRDTINQEEAPEAFAALQERVAVMLREEVELDLTPISYGDLDLAVNQIPTAVLVILESCGLLRE